MICKVCKRYFKAKKENKYNVLNSPELPWIKPTVLECFDCPRCGCQNIVNVREGAKPSGGD